MPYNTAPIKPSDAVNGSSSLPLARVKKIISMDEDIAACSNNAAFAISVATELFIRYLTEQAYNVVKSERKPRRNLQYKDFANAVARIDNLEFLTDVVPKTTTYRQVKEKRAREAAHQAQAQAIAVEAGQMTLDGSGHRVAPQLDVNMAHSGQPESSRTAVMNGTAGDDANGYYDDPESPSMQPYGNGHYRPGEDSDVQMID